MESGETSGLLRSALVLPHARKQGIGAQLIAALFTSCWQSGHRIIYCFSIGAGD